MSDKDKLTGKVKEAVADLTDDGKLRREGQKEQKKGEKKEELKHADERAEEKEEEVEDLERDS